MKNIELILKGTDGEMVKAIVNYCYTGHINLTEENVETFLAIASSIDLDMLNAECFHFYDEKLGINNCVNTLIIANKYNWTHLCQRAFHLICENFENVPTTEIQKLDHRILQEILKCDELKANEQLVCKRLFEWFQYNENERAQYMSDMLRSIRLELIPYQVRFQFHSISISNSIDLHV